MKRNRIKKKKRCVNCMRKVKHHSKITGGCPLWTRGYSALRFFQEAWPPESPILIPLTQPQGWRTDGRLV